MVVDAESSTSIPIVPMGMPDYPEIAAAAAFKRSSETRL
jgi:hypothetical protein